MATYGLYKNINPDTLSGAASALIEEVNSRGRAVSEFDNGLSDGIWKCSAKGTFKEGLGKISGEVVTNINTSLNKLITVAGYIASYKSAEETANGIKTSLTSTPNTEENAGTIASLQKDLQTAESEMEKYESQVKGMM